MYIHKSHVAGIYTFFKNILNYLLDFYLTMTTFANLPSDIIIAIASFQRPTNGMVSDWKHTLCLLSICRSWRAAMLHDIYGTVFIAIPEDYLYSHQFDTRRLPSRYIIPYTNVGLVYDNGYGYLVKRMIINSQSTCKIPCPWLYMAEALGVDENECPEVLAVRKWMETDMSAEYQVALENSAWIDTFGPVARVLALKLPNITRLRISTSGYSMTQTDVISKFVSVYASQLVKVELQNFNVSPAFLKAVNIRYYDNTVYYDFLNKSCINPHLLVCLKLRNVFISDVWNQFVCDNGTKSIEFTNLESLELRRNSSANSVAPITKSWHLKFPNLIHLKIDSDMLTNKELKLMALNLKTLEYSGSCDSAAELFENNIGGLDKLHLNVPTFVECKSDCERLISQTNKIFSMMGPIPEVSLMGVQIHSSCLSRIYWPNLTQLELTTSIEPCEFLRSIDCMPHLLHLRIIVINSPYETDDIEEYNHSDRYTGTSRYPDFALSQLSLLKISGHSRSKLATLTIHWFTRDAYAWYADNIIVKPVVDSDPGLKEFFDCQDIGSCSLDSDDSGSDYDSTELLGDDAMGNFGKPNREEPMQDAEAEAALKAYLPNLVATSFAILSRDYISNDSDSS